MKLKALCSVMLVAFLTIGLYVRSDAQTKTDSVAFGSDTVHKVVLKGTEKTQADSLKAIGNALKDTTLSDIINKAVTVINDKPAAGSTWQTYVPWGVAIVSLITALVTYIKNKFGKASPT